MKKLMLSILIAAGTALPACAQQPVNGTSYYLPKTTLRFTLLIERTTYTPGEFAIYADRYMKTGNVQLQPGRTYRIVSTRMVPVGVPDSAKQFTLDLEKKLSISNIDRDENGILLAINAKGHRQELPAPFVPDRKKTLPNPREFMNEDILTAGSTAKMAELTAQEIYDVRENRSMLAKGQAEFMPKDGEQLRIMMNSLNRQEAALMQTFEGTSVKDTTEVVLNFTPTAETDRQLFFRFSKKLGLTDTDDLGGSPYYISVKRANNVPTPAPTAREEKKAKDDFGLYVNVPDKIEVTLYKEEQPVEHYDVLAGQFGKTEIMSAELFGKKQTSKLLLYPVTGSIEKIEVENLK